jgi:hypothetical protein
VRDALRRKDASLKFPADLDALSGYIVLNNSDVPGIVPQNIPLRWFVRMNIGRSLADQPKLSWAYPGAGKLRGNGNELVFWCHGPDGYKGIYGDLSIKNLTGPMSP